MFARPRGGQVANPNRVAVAGVNQVQLDGAWAAGAGMQVVELATGHDPMISAPEELVRLLLA